MSEAQSEHSSVTTNLLAFVLGVAVGATVAILYAPAAGTETRAQIAEKAHQVKEKASQLGEQVAERAGHLKEQVASMRRKSGEQAVGEIATGEAVASVDGAAAEASSS